MVPWNLLCLLEKTTFSLFPMRLYHQLLVIESSLTCQNPRELPDFCLIGRESHSSGPCSFFPPVKKPRSKYFRFCRVFLVATTQFCHSVGKVALSDM